MGEDKGRQRRSGRSKAFAATSRGSVRVGWRTLVMVGLAPGLIYSAHLVFGANQMIAAQWFTGLLALALGLGLMLPRVRIGLADLRPVLPPTLLFAAVLLVAALTLTPFTPGGPHPIWAWAGFDGASTINRSATIVEMVKLCGLACIFLLGALQGVGGDRARATVEALLALGALYSAIALLTFLAGVQLAPGGRLSGGFLSANSGATVFGVLTILSMANLLRRWRRSSGLSGAERLSRLAVPISYVLLVSACLILTASRMGGAATALAAGVLLIWEMLDARGDRLPVLMAGLALLVTAGVLLMGGNDLLWARLEGLDSDAAVREAIFGAHWKAFLDSPLFGYGLGSFNDLNAQILTTENYGALWSIRATHNVYLQWLEEAGIIGAAPMFLLIATVIAVSAWRTGQARSGQSLMRGLVAANLVVLVHGFTDYALQVPSVAAMWAFLLGLQFAWGRARG